MKDFTRKQDNVSVLSAEELNSVFNELENLVTSSGQSLNGGDLLQVSKALSHYASQATWYTCSGSANAYILTAPSSVAGTTAYVAGQAVQFQINAANTGASTVNVAGLGVKSLKGFDGTSDLSAGDLPLNGIATAYYDGTVFRLLSIGFSSAPSVSAPALSRSAPCGRLTLTSNTPYVYGSATGSTLYYTPAYGLTMSIWNGTAWQGRSLAAEASIALPATTNTMYDVFAYASGNDVAIELVAWTGSNTVRGAALAKFQGALVKASDYTRLYVGSVATGTVSGQSEDSPSRRLVFNYGSDVPSSAYCATSSNRIGSYSVAVAFNGTLGTDPSQWGASTSPRYLSSSLAPVIGQDSVQMVVGVDSVATISNTLTVCNNGQLGQSFVAQISYDTAVVLDGLTAVIDSTRSSAGVGSHDNTTGTSNASSIGQATITAGLRTFSSTVWRSSPDYPARKTGACGLGNSLGHQLSVTLNS